MNRVLRDLRHRELIVLDHRTLTILDWQGLTALADFDATYLHENTNGPNPV